MHARTLALSLAPLWAASLAHAQAPGEFAPPPPVAASPSRPSVMDDRWAIGLSLGSMSLSPERDPDAHIRFTVAELALRFRATLHLELALSAGGGRERTAEDQEGDLAVSEVAIAARYRFRPEAAWNWFVMGGLGGAAVARHDATDEELDRAAQPMAMLGIGLERRFRHFALQAEARAIGMGDERDEAMSPTAEAVGAPSVEARQARSGGAVSIGLGYYF